MHERSAVGSPTALVYSSQALISFACPSRVLCILFLIRSHRDVSYLPNGKGLDCHASLPKLFHSGPKSPAMNHIFNVLGLRLILDTRGSHPMENPSALRLYRHAKIDPMICKLTGPGDDHGGILTHLLAYRTYVFHGIEAYRVIKCMCFTVLELTGL